MVYQAKSINDVSLKFRIFPEEVETSVDYVLHLNIDRSCKKKRVTIIKRLKGG